MNLTIPALALVRRELVSALRGRTLWWFLLLQVAALYFMVWTVWPSEVLLAGAPIYTATRVFIPFAIVMLCAAVLLMPGLGASSIVAERDGDTHDQLHLTLIRPSGMVVGKLLNSLGVLGLFFVASLPIVSAVMFLPGLDLAQFMAAPVVGLAAAVTCGLLGMAGASLYRNTVRAMMTAYFLMLMYMGLPVFLLGVLADGLNWNWLLDRIMDWGMWMSPFAALVVSLEGRGGYGAVLPKMVAFSALVSAVSFLVAWRGMRRPLPPEATEARPPRRLLRRSRARDLAEAIGMDRVTFPDGVNPILVREVLCSPFRRRRPFLKALRKSFFWFTAVNVVLLVWGLEEHANAEDIAIMAVIMQMIALTVLAPGYAANTLTKEREFGNTDLLRSTLMRPLEIVGGKALGALVLAAPFYLGQVLATFPIVLVALLYSGHHGGELALVRLGTGYVSMGVCLVVVVSLAVFASARSRRTGGAVVLTYILTALAMGGISLGLVYIFEELIPGRWPDEGYYAAFPSPIAAYFVAGIESRNNPHISYWFTNVVMWIILGALIVVGAAAQFARRCRADSV